MASTRNLACENDMKKPTRLLLALIGALPSSAVFACASCGCSINSDWSAQGLSPIAGWSADLRYDYLNQNKLWKGTSSISPPRHNGCRPDRSCI